METSIYLICTHMTKKAARLYKLDIHAFPHCLNHIQCIYVSSFFALQYINYHTCHTHPHVHIYMKVIKQPNRWKHFISTNFNAKSLF